MRITFRKIAAPLVLALSMLGALPLYAEDAFNPLRLSYIDGQVSLLRSGAANWAEARINTPLASGDVLYTADASMFELQGARHMYIRADGGTELTLAEQAPDFVRVNIRSGRIAIGLPGLPDGNTVEIDTPNAAFTLDRPGYYRTDVEQDVRFSVRRGGHALMAFNEGGSVSVLSSYEVTVPKSAQPEIHAAAEPDAWDRWNYERSDALADAKSRRYVPAEIAGAEDLDRYGDWRDIEDYGPVWVPQGEPAGWVPYSSGHWIWDPYYRWTWVDDAPWGWAPFHYGRWVNLSGSWCWAPGPVRHAVYAPALVAFFGAGSGRPEVGWVALSWGEPVIPWWGHAGFIGRPWWGGWEGPRMANRIATQQSAQPSALYANGRVSGAVVVASTRRFGMERIDAQPLQQKRALTPIRGALPIKSDPARFAGAPSVAIPPSSVTARQIVTSRPGQPAKPQALQPRFSGHAPLQARDEARSRPNAEVRHESAVAVPQRHQSGNEARALVVPSPSQAVPSVATRERRLPSGTSSPGSSLADRPLSVPPSLPSVRKPESPSQTLGTQAPRRMNTPAAPRPVNTPHVPHAPAPTATDPRREQVLGTSDRPAAAEASLPPTVVPLGERPHGEENWMPGVQSREREERMPRRERDEGTLLRPHGQQQRGQRQGGTESQQPPAR